MLRYYDPKNLNLVRGEINLKSPSVTFKFLGKTKDTFEINDGQNTYLFKEGQESLGQIKEWEDCLKKFNFGFLRRT